MNGAEQRARGGEVLRLDKKIDELEKEFTALTDSIITIYHTESEERKQAIESLKSLVAQMIDGETQYRLNAIGLLRKSLTEKIDTNIMVMFSFVKLVWWRRYLWVLFGVRSLEWFRPTPPQPTTQAVITDVPKARYGGEKPR